MDDTLVSGNTKSNVKSNVKSNIKGNAKSNIKNTKIKKTSAEQIKATSKVTLDESMPEMDTLESGSALDVHPPGAILVKQPILPPSAIARKKTITLPIPIAWHSEVHSTWLQGGQQRLTAIQTLIGLLNEHVLAHQVPPKTIFEQICYYLYNLGDHKACQILYDQALNHYPDDLNLLMNAAVVHASLGHDEQAIALAKKTVQRDLNNAIAYDILASKMHLFGNKKGGKLAGTLSLEIKDRLTSDQIVRPLPAKRPSAGLDRIDALPNVLAFCLWGTSPRYLRGALQNVLLAPHLYPDWQIRIDVDETVPIDFIELVRSLGATVVLHKGQHHDLRERLTWRFQVANDPNVGYFVVRDADAILHWRERVAVQHWLDGDKHFHVMRDWWSHTDLMLAGMWGGVAGILPDITQLLAHYQPSQMETANIDQWFLRDCIWPIVRQSVCVHDRFFQPPGALPMPTAAPPSPQHLGQNEYAAAPAKQAKWLSAWIAQYDWLQDKR